MAKTSALPASQVPASRPRRRRSIRRLASSIAASASDRSASLWLVIGFALIHTILWTLILTRLKAGQDVHFDVAEAFDWGQKFLLGYGKHPPLSGWVAGVWFMLFPAADWATYALAMATVGCGLVICWLIALRVVDGRRAFLTVVMLAIYPIFNFKGYKYNPDLLQLVTLPLVVLAYLNAFEKRTVWSGLWLGLAGALALMTKYWVLTMFGAIGIAALLHPDRWRFLASPAPWVAIATLVIAMLPHLWWLKHVDFAPLTYAGDVYAISSRAQCFQLVLDYFGHNLALLALPVALAVIALNWRHPLTPSRIWSAGPNPGVNLSQAINVWIIQAVVAIGPGLGALAFNVYLKTDWGISLFFLVPLALVAISSLRVPKVALFYLVAIWFAATVALLAGSPAIAEREMAKNAAHVSDENKSMSPYSARSDLARDLTETWHQHLGSPWRVVVGTTEVGEPMTFYSPDHPATYTPGELWGSGLTSLDEAKRLGFIGICDTSDYRVKDCEAWMKVNAAQGQHLIMNTRRFFGGHAGPSTSWSIYLVPPAR